MVYIINNYNGSQLVGINDKTVNNTATSLRLPGRDYRPYGEVVVENMVWMLQHFSAATPPLNAIQGQIWYDSANQELNVWNGATWINTGKTLTGTQFPSVAQLGQLFYHLSKKQLFVYDSTASWRLMSAQGAADLSDPVPSAPISFTDSQVFTVTDVDDGNHSIIRLSVQGTVIAVWSSSDEFEIAPGAIPGFTPIQVKPGLNMEPGFVLEGEVALATTATNSLNLGGVPAANWMRRDQTNTPQNANVDLGSVASPFKDMYATNFYGLASAATTAVTATTAATANLATNSTQLNGQAAAFYLNASNINAGTLNAARLPFTPVNKAGDTLVGSLSMSGTLTLSGNPTVDLQAATKQYVDTRVPYTFTYGSQQASTNGFSTGGVDYSQNFFDVFPPSGKTMSNLVAFTSGIGIIEFAGVVNFDDTLISRWENQGDRIRVWSFNTEQRGLPASNYLAIWS